MIVLIMYDISVSSPGGTKRLQKAAKTCLAYGQRIQNSVYECDISTLEYEQMKQELLQILDLDHDRLRFYRIPSKNKNYKETFGSEMEISLDDPIIF